MAFRLPPLNLSYVYMAKVQVTSALPATCFVYEVGFWRNHSPVRHPTQHFITHGYEAD